MLVHNQADTMARGGEGVYPARGYAGNTRGGGCRQGIRAGAQCAGGHGRYPPQMGSHCCLHPRSPGNRRAHAPVAIHKKPAVSHAASHFSDTWASCSYTPAAIPRYTHPAVPSTSFAGHDWVSVSDASLHSFPLAGERNVLSFLSPDSGYDR